MILTNLEGDGIQWRLGLRRNWKGRGTQEGAEEGKTSHPEEGTVLFREERGNLMGE